jgi:hypothetical protein
VDKNVGLSAGIIALLALAARVALPTANERGSAAQASAGKATNAQAQAAAATPQYYEGPWLATRHFFAPYEQPSSVAVDFKDAADILRCSGDPQCRPQLRRYFGLPDTGGVECLLATVPDPLHTRLALFTDHAIDAIRRGAGATNWEFATQWLPWKDTVDPNEADPEKRAKERSGIRAQEKQPGVLVFRDSDWHKGPLLIFLVGETLTAGVNPDQFQIARAYMQALCDPRVDSGAVRIAGPTFSGSFYSLAELIQQDKIAHPGKIYNVHSGTATDPRAARRFRDRTGPEVRFHSATENLWDQDRHFRRVLHELRIPPDRAAALTEDNSTFGRAASIEIGQTSSSAASRQEIRVFSFPRDISHLRDAYRQVLQASKSDKTSVPNLDFSLKDSGVGEDSVPTFSQTQTPLSQNSVINEIARTIRRDDIRMVAVSATNVLDMLFLAGVLRRQCPNTRLLMQSGDLLFIQAEQTESLEGTLFLTSYPLFTESKLWQERRRGRKNIAIFPDTLSEGTFNATVLLLAGPGQREHVLADYAWQSVPYPPAWLMTLDHRGFMPVRVWDDRASTDWSLWVRGEDGNPDLASVTAPTVWKILLSAFALCGTAIGLWILGLSRKKDWMIDARVEPTGSGDSWHGLYLFLLLLILIAVQMVIFTARPFVNDWSLLILLLPGCGLPAWIAVRHCHPANKRRLSICLAAVAAPVALWSFCCFGDPPRSQLFSFRAAELRFGSSPLWPVLAASAAMLLWCFVHVTRLYFAAYQQPGVVAIDADTALKGRLEKSHGHFTDSVRSALGLFSLDADLLARRLFGFRIALLAALGLCVLFRVDVQLGSIDGAWYDLLCIPLQLTVAGLLLLTCWQIRGLWKSLHGFTTSLDILPLAGAFLPVSTAGGHRPIWVRRFNFQSLDIHTNSLLLLHDMALQPEQLANYWLSADQVKLWQAHYLAQVDRALPSGSCPSRAVLTEEHRKLWEASKELAGQMWQRILVPAWKSEALVGKLAVEPSSKPDKPAPAEEETAAPSRPKALHIQGDPKNVADLAAAFVALHFSAFLLYGVQQIRNLLWFPSVGFVLLMLGMTSYNFQAPHMIGRFLMLLFAAIACMLGICMVQMERDPILSRIAGSKPGELSVTFYLKLARYGALPLLGLLAWQFPWLSNMLSSWIEPALDALQ